MRARVLVVALLSAAPTLQAQTTTRETPLLATPTGRAVATLARGAAVGLGASRDSFVEVTVGGWLGRSSLQLGRDSSTAVVRTGDARLRVLPASRAPLVAGLQRGTSVVVVTRAREWIQVERTGWVARRSLDIPARAKAAAPRTPQRATPAQTRRGAAATRPAPAPAAKNAVPPVAVAGADSMSLDALTPTRTTPLATSPGGTALGTVGRGTILEPQARDRGWVRVRLEAWVRESDLVAADTTVRSPSAADLRARPDAMRGQLVRWTVQVLAFRRGDGLRRDVEVDEPYLLVQGPGSEGALAYVTVPPALLAEARALPPMSVVIVTARVRTGRSAGTGVPVLELRTLARK